MLYGIVLLKWATYGLPRQQLKSLHRRLWSGTPWCKVAKRSRRP